jgi:hypothetical protein
LSPLARAVAAWLALGLLLSASCSLKGWYDCQTPCYGEPTDAGSDAPDTLPPPVG